MRRQDLGIKDDILGLAGIKETMPLARLHFVRLTASRAQMHGLLTVFAHDADRAFVWQEQLAIRVMTMQRNL